MIVRDFLEGGFPISRRCPVLWIKDGKAGTANNSTELKKAIDENEDPVCFGIWPGRKTTGLYILKPAFYGKIVPPTPHADIDSATQIEVIKKGATGEFDRVEYMPGPHAEQVMNICRDEGLLKYLEKSPLKFRVKSE